MGLFIDTFFNKIDRKGRVSVPALYRSILASQSFQGIIAFPSFKHPAIVCAGIDWFEKLNTNLTHVNLFSDAHDDFTATLFADAKQLSFDSEGRIIIPESLIQHALLKDVFAFVGRGQIFEIWQPEILEKHKSQARKRALDKGHTLTQSFEQDKK
ncbi:MAG: division/cell wall cluster transcriptional repressor MraZ [Alphaproteobacteria bacterium]|nr:division/cell wall cluster transcriptional repressor MraZ [Alphaproteobacteria bacterium]